ncbi:MAG: inorganic pyrophosphatase [Oscillospiraceae bacterium]|nr:inorganic pyrophosphatase [Oscillospiraceae bacterium]
MDLLQLLGKSVDVIVDRPLGTTHPNHKDIIYPINYGYIENIFARDGEEQDAYILGVDERVDSFSGTVIAIIRRLDDVEDKLVVAPDNMKFTLKEIMEKVHFQEQYFETEIIMN